MQTEKKTRNNNSTIKQRYECLMDWRKENNIVCKPPKKETSKADLTHEMNILTKPYKDKSKWLKQQQKN